MKKSNHNKREGTILKDVTLSQNPTQWLNLDFINDEPLSKKDLRLNVSQFVTLSHYS